MSKTIPQPKAGDPCPNCGERALRKARVPTDAEYAASVDRENPQVLPANSDSASPEQREQLGELYRCASCSYQTRIKPEAEAPARETGAATSSAPAASSAPSAPASSSSAGPQPANVGAVQG